MLPRSTAVKTPLNVLAEVQMILAEHKLSNGAVTDRDCIEQITALLDTPEVILAFLMLEPKPAKAGDGSDSSRDELGFAP
jgi:hypothetical protein